MSDEIMSAAVVFTDAIYRATDRDSLREAVQQASQKLGFDAFMLSCHKVVDPDIVLDATLTNFAPSFLDDYGRFGWFEDDFLIQRALGAEASFWTNPKGERRRKVGKRSYADFLEASGIVGGLMAPLGRCSGTASALSLVSSRREPYAPIVAQAGRLLAMVAMAKTEVLGLAPQMSPDESAALRRLSAVQRDVLNWVAEGKSNIDIATIMGLNERAVRYHVTQILQKLGVATRLQAATLRRRT